MSEYAGRIAIGAIVAVAFAVGLGYELSTYVPGSGVSNSITTANVTSWFGNEAPPSGCGNMTLTEHLTGYRTGYIMDMYISPPLGGVGQYYLLGSTICFYTYLQNVSNQSSSLPSSENLKVVHYTNQTPGATFFESSCPVPAYSGSFGANSTGWNCEVVWHTSQPYNGTLPIAGSIQNGDAYIAGATVTMSNSTSTIKAAEIFNFRTTTPLSTDTTSSNLAPTLSCGGPVFKLLTPEQNGSLFLKVETDQGSVITNNGTVFVTHTVPAASGVSGGTTDYCLRLQGNATGYLDLAANDGLPQTGSYNMTLFAGYGQGPGYQGAIPPFTVQTNTTAYVTVSVPSGGWTITTCAPGGGCATTTTSAVSQVTSTTTSTASASSSSSPQSLLPGCNVLVGSVSKEGFQLDVYVESNTTKVGGNIIICTDFQNLSNDTATTYAANDVITITNSSGSVVAQLGCGGANVMQVPPGFDCSTNWMTSIAGTTKLAPGIAPGTYTLNVVVPLAPSSQEGYSTIEYTTTLILTN